VTVNTTTHTYSLTSDYWALAQFSKFIQLGAMRIDSTDPSSCITSPASGWNCGLEDIAFRNPDGSQVIVATAHDGHSHVATIAEHGQSVSYNVPDGAIVTFVIPPPKPIITGLRLPRRARAHALLRASFTLNEAATVRANLTRTSGQSGTVAVRTLAGAEGANRFALSDRRTRARLIPGRYRLVLTAIDAGGDRGGPVSAVVMVGASRAATRPSRPATPAFTG
jgi:hypothetical protein